MNSDSELKSEKSGLDMKPASFCCDKPYRVDFQLVNTQRLGGLNAYESRITQNSNKTTVTVNDKKGEKKEGKETEPLHKRGCSHIDKENYARSTQHLNISQEKNATVKLKKSSEHDVMQEKKIKMAKESTLKLKNTKDKIEVEDEFQNWLQETQQEFNEVDKFNLSINYD